MGRFILGALSASNQRLSALIAAGTSICGVTAIVALAPVIGATQAEISVAVANIVLFGLLGMLVYPHLIHFLVGQEEEKGNESIAREEKEREKEGGGERQSERVGMFLGTAIHDTSQVLGASLTYQQMFNDDVVVAIAAVQKLTRNILLALVIPGLGYWYAAAAVGATATPGMAVKRLDLLSSLKKYTPGFVIGFLLMAAVRSVGDYVLLQPPPSTSSLPLPPCSSSSADLWKRGTSLVGGPIANQCLGSAMAAVGLATSLAVLKGVGARPFLLGFTGCLIVGGTGFVMAFLCAPLIATGRRKKE